MCQATRSSCRLGDSHTNNPSSSSRDLLTEAHSVAENDALIIQQQQHHHHQQRICILGAGPGGLSLAHYLQQSGYTAVHVYEKASIVGGKTTGVWCQSRQQYIGSGQYTINKSYMEMMELSESFNVDLVGEEMEITYFDTQSKMFRNGADVSAAMIFREIFKTSKFLNMPYLSNPFCYMISKLSLASPLSWGIVWAAFSSILDEKSKEDISKIFRYMKALPDVGFTGILPDTLCETVSNFLDLENMSSSARLCIETIWNKWAPAGYLSCASSVPALFKLKLMQIAPFRGWHMVKPDGYYKLCKAMEEKINGVKGSAVYTSTPIETIQRNDDGGVNIRVNGNEIYYDQLIITGHLNDVVPLMVDSSNEELELSKQIVTTDYVVTLAEISGLPPQPLIYIPSHWEPHSTGHVFLVSKARYKDLESCNNQKECYSIFQYGTSYETGEKISDEKLLDLLLEDIKLLGGTVNIIDGQKRWNYFPHPTVESLKSGFFQKLEKIQGVRCTFYAGSTLNFELTEATVRYSKYLVENRFLFDHPVKLSSMKAKYNSSSTMSHPSWSSTDDVSGRRKSITTTCIETTFHFLSDKVSQMMASSAVTGLIFSATALLISQKMRKIE